MSTNTRFWVMVKYGVDRLDGFHGLSSKCVAVTNPFFTLFYFDHQRSQIRVLPCPV
jgi:hypothetical protein